MITALFGATGSGRIGRGAHLLLTLLVLGLFLALAFGLGLGWGLKNVLPVFLPAAAVLGFARLNLAAKRWRHVGLPGWPVALGTALALGLAFALLPPAWGLWGLLGLLLVEMLLPPLRPGAARG